MCIRLKTIRDRNVSIRDGSRLYLAFLSFFVSTYTLRDGWQSIDIRGNEVGVLQKQKHTQTCWKKKREGHKWSIALIQKRMRGRGEKKAVHFVLWFMAHLLLCLYELLSWCLNCGNAFIRPAEQRELNSSSAPNRHTLWWCLRWKTESLFKH